VEAGRLVRLGTAAASLCCSGRAGAATSAAQHSPLAWLLACRKLHHGSGTIEAPTKPTHRPTSLGARCLDSSAGGPPAPPGSKARNAKTPSTVINGAIAAWFQGPSTGSISVRQTSRRKINCVVQIQQKLVVVRSARHTRCQQLAGGLGRARTQESHQRARGLAPSHLIICLMFDNTATHAGLHGSLFQPSGATCW
jgi:hypothetical protein